MGVRTEWRCDPLCLVGFYDDPLLAHIRRVRISGRLSADEVSNEHLEGCRPVLVVDAELCRRCDGKGTIGGDEPEHVGFYTETETCSACGGLGAKPEGLGAAWRGEKNMLLTVPHGPVSGVHDG
jgi:hypothetical protein